jgi:hypothetical protein
MISLKASQKAGMMKGRRILCRYRGEPLWYERLLLGCVGELSSVWAIATPDGDVHVED